MPYGKYYSKIEKELDNNLNQAEYEKLRKLVDQLESFIGDPDPDLGTRFPETAKYLNKLYRAVTFLEYDHGGRFDW